MTNAAGNHGSIGTAARSLAPLLLAALVAVSGTASADEGATGEAEGTEIRYLTGLGVSYWADEDATVFGPGLTWGLRLIPERLDLHVRVGALMGDGTYTVPVELRFEIPFEITGWMDLYLAPGPTLLFDRFDGAWHHDLALSASGGIALSPAGYDWALRASGDYNLRLWREVRNGGGFSVGFLYGF
jgi:hypothetical protein